MPTLDTMIKGIDAEVRVREIMRSCGYDPIHNIVIGNEEKTSQLDLVMVHTTGVYMVEVKNITGRIYGYRKQKYWKAYYNYRPFDMYNPVFQNEGHIRNLLKMGDMPVALTDKVFNLVVIPDEAELVSDAVEVIRESEVYDIVYVKEDVFTEEEVIAITEYLFKWREEHIHLQFVHGKSMMNRRRTV